MDIAVVINMQARRGSEAVAATCRSWMPGARVLASRSLEETAAFTEALRAAPPDLLVSAGGDGTAVDLLNRVRGNIASPSPTVAPPAASDGAASPSSSVASPASSGSSPPSTPPSSEANGAREPLFGVLPLGTGNAWANTTGAPRWRAAVQVLGRVSGVETELPRRTFDLVDVCGVQAPFAGTGWDAEIIEDFHAQKEGFGFLPKRAREGAPGYLYATFTRTIPRHLRLPRVEIVVRNLGEPALHVDRAGRLVPVESDVLYRGPVSICAASTVPEFGFRFRAFPFAGVAPGRFSLRLFSGGPIAAAMRMAPIWRGRHPIAHMHEWLVTRCRVELSREVPLQIGGDGVGLHREIEYAISSRPVDVLDWHALGPLKRRLRLV